MQGGSQLIQKTRPIRVVYQKLFGPFCVPSEYFKAISDQKLGNYIFQISRYTQKFNSLKMLDQFFQFLLKKIN
jgi:hypothetical protein